MISILHASLEYKKGVGGIKSVLTGVLPALVRAGDLKVDVITPFFDVYDDFYQEKTIDKIATVTHIYKGRNFQSDVFRVCTEVINDQPIYHYMIRPVKNSSVAWLFNIKDERDLYQAFEWSEPSNRIEYFIGCVAALIRVPYTAFPEYDIFHGHAWHSSLAGCLIKEFENLTSYKSLLPDPAIALRKAPYILSTVHMLTAVESGQLTSTDSVKDFIQSLGLPLNLAHKFPEHRIDVQENRVKRVVLALLYSDMVSMVSKGLVNEVTHGQAAGLEQVFSMLAAKNRLYGITNGITVNNWDATQHNNLGEFTFQPDLTPVSVTKQHIKEKLAASYPKLDPKKLWFVFIGRFANEKGMDMLLPASEAIEAMGANFIVMGMHVAFTTIDGVRVPVFKDIMDGLKSKSNVVVIENGDEQKQFGRLFRAATEYMLVTSHNEACGLISMEGLCCAALTVAPRIQGIPDSVRPMYENFTRGTGFLYSDDPATRNENIKIAIQEAVAFYNARRAEGVLDALLARLLHTAKEFDWDVTPAPEYKGLYSRIIQRPLLTVDQIRVTTPQSMLTQFAGLTFSPFRGKVFQIGFNKCGSQTIHNYFCVNGVPSIHYGNANGSIARKINANMLAGNPLLSTEFDKFIGFFDMEDPYADPPIYIAPMCFQQLDAQYPDSKFILNTRSKTYWLASRTKHVDQTNGIRYVDVLCAKYNLTEEQLVERWSKEWDAHHAAVLQHFASRPKDLLIFNIDSDSPQKINDFFADRFTFDTKLYGHFNKTPVTEAVKPKMLA